MSAIAGDTANESGVFHCERCGNPLRIRKGEMIPRCPSCGNDRYGERSKEPGRRS